MFCACLKSAWKKRQNKQKQSMFGPVVLEITCCIFTNKAFFYQWNLHYDKDNQLSQVQNINTTAIVS